MANDRKIDEVQLALSQLNLYTGKIDGIQGDYTTAAIISFQRMNGLPTSGKYSDKLDELLFPDDEPNRTDTEDSSFKFGAPHDDTQSLRNFYGQEGTNIVVVTLPYKMRAAWDMNQIITRASVNRKCQAQFLDVWERTLNHYGIDGIHDLELDITGGTFNNRTIRGGSRPSTHAFGCAWDINPAKNPYKGKWRNSQLSKPEYEPFRLYVKENGGIFLGEVEDFDSMHIQFAHRG